MKKFISIIFITFWSFVFCACSGNDTSIHDANGKVIPQSSLKHKWIIINYWASWCDNCLREIPQLNEFYKIQDQQTILLGYNYDHLNGDDLKNAMTKAGIAFPNMTEDPNLVFKVPDPDIVPITYIINPHGKLVKKIIGANTKNSLLKTLEQAKKNEV